jgi:hypothetical protein
MAAAVTILNQKKVPGVGLFTAGRLNLSANYPAGGELGAVLGQYLKGSIKIDLADFQIASEFTAAYDSTNSKIRVFKITAGATAEVAAGAYGATPAIPFLIISR